MKAVHYTVANALCCVAIFEILSAFSSSLLCSLSVSWYLGSALVE